MSNSKAARDGVRKSIGEKIVGRGRELDLLWAAVAAGRNILLEGPPGTSKTTMLKAITSDWGVPLVMVEGNAELTPAKLVGHHSPFRVMRDDYSAENFVPGPLVTAMQQGGFLYIEELNRAPEDSLNTLLVAMADRNITVPRVGVIEAKPTFRVVASMNPFDNVGTYRLSRSIHDRLCRLAVDYQDEVSEQEIVVSAISQEIPAADPRLVSDAVAVTRATRDHPLVRQGSSVRGAIDLVLVVHALDELRGGIDGDDAAYADLVFDGMIVALSGRIELDAVADTTPEAVLRVIWEDRFVRKHPATVHG